jgi:hypothetical protein
MTPNNTVWLELCQREIYGSTLEMRPSNTFVIIRTPARFSKSLICTSNYDFCPIDANM